METCQSTLSALCFTTIKCKLNYGILTQQSQGWYGKGPGIKAFIPANQVQGGNKSGKNKNRREIEKFESMQMDNDD